VFRDEFWVTGDMRPTKTYLFRFIKAGCVCTALTAFFVSAAHSRPKSNLTWDWSGIIGTGQSLSVGAQGRPLISTNQPYGNLKLATDHLPWPVDPNDTNLALVPLVEPVGRFATNYPSSWPDNIDGETPHSAMANEITALARGNLGRDYVSVHGAVGEDGQGMIFLKKDAVPKGVNGHSYAAALIEAKAITRLAKAARKTYGVGAIIVTHGESDAGNPNYENELRQLWQDYNTDLPAITGQIQKIQMIVSQQNSCADRSLSTLAQWKVSDDYPADMACSGPKYQYPSAEGIHLTAEGYRQLGEKYGQVYYQRVILGKDWRPLEPTGVERSGKIFTVHYHVPVPPLVWDTNLESPHQSIAEWKDGKGFEVSTASDEKMAITSVAISGNDVVVTCASDPGPGARVGYAMMGEKNRMTTPFPGTFRWGLLRDSDPFVGAVTGLTQPNYGVAFEMLVP
jgi:lysophospholipase L1-like esterase